MCIMFNNLSYSLTYSIVSVKYYIEVKKREVLTEYSNRFLVVRFDVHFTLPESNNV